MITKSGKTLTIFIILITILLVSATAIGFFMYQKESQLRKDIESQLEEAQGQLVKKEEVLKEARNQMALLQDKNKEADKKINNLMDEMELNEGLHSALKKENNSLKESVEIAKKEKEAIRFELEAAAKKLQESQEILKAEQDKTKDLLAKMNALEEAKKKAEATLQDPSKMELGKLVIGEDKNQGHILSVDKESAFVICSLGTSKGVKVGDILSVYRGDQYLGDIKVSRAQEEMSAADFVAPLSSRKVRKNDIVVLKQS